MDELVNILIVDDNEDDVEFTLAALQGTKLANSIDVVSDGIQALAFLRKEEPYTEAKTPSLIFLDLNMPRKNGLEVLAEMKADPVLRQIPVVILTTSEAEEDIVKSYELYANCFVSKPVNLTELAKVVRTIDDFWFGVVRLPPKR